MKYKRDFKNYSLLLLGGGSNILFTKDYNGIVIKINTKGIDVIDENQENIYIRAYAGEVWKSFVDYCIDKGWAGLENLSMIPGNVGGCPLQNIGAYGVEVKDSIEELEAINIKTSEIKIFKNKMCNFGYRDSIFKNELKNQYIIHSIVFKLSKNPIFHIEYGAIKDEIKAMGVKSVDIKSISNAICKIRSEKLPDTKILGNAGSFFKNPVISSGVLNELRIQYPNIIGYHLEDGRYKLAAGYLIESCGWKGKKIGECGVYKNQSLVLVNFGKASGNEIADLALKIKDSVFRKFKINLETEVNIF